MGRASTPYPGPVFGRTRPQQSQPAVEVASPQVKESGKGRATPRRREQEQRNRTPIVGASARSAAQIRLAKAATREERKAARRELKAEKSAQARKQRVALASGDGSNLPARDQGEVRAWVRDYVDSRRSLGEYMMPVALFLLLMSITGAPLIQGLSTLLLYAFIIAVITDSVLLRRRITRLVQDKFRPNATGAPGAGAYGMLRALQLRRSRLPRARVKRGELAR